LTCYFIYKTIKAMVIETFLIFLNALLSLNPPAEAQGQQDKTRTEVQNQGGRQQQETDLGRGGWDRN
jgi:hypothetical protein